ncbi:MAG: four helix bundle protein [Pseudobdellovibrionaceae bacterium]|nr:four helix bundle protein [Bdellovibrionales bacterium]USN47025.1 MAG: four helix bundle protein [Pseudobdellovibrionaceae bacterium]
MMKEAKVFADSYQLGLIVFERTKAFPKHLRPTLGRKLEEGVITLLVAVREACLLKGSTRFKKLQQASHALDEIRILCQMSCDLRVFSAGMYHDISVLTSEIGREIGGFIRHERGQRNGENKPKTIRSGV